MSVRSFLRDIFALLLLYKLDNLIIPILYWGPQVLRCSCTLASVVLATGVELSMRMCEHLELIGAAAVGKISCRQFPPFKFVLVEVLCYIPLRLEK